MGSERKEEIKKVSGKELAAVADKGPEFEFEKLQEFEFEKLQEFNNDVQTLPQRMSALYHQDKETLMILSLLGVSVKVTVTMNNGENVLGEFEVGATLSDTPKNNG